MIHVPGMPFPENLYTVFLQQGNEKLPILSHGSERNTGFTHGTKARPVFYSKVGQVGAF